MNRIEAFTLISKENLEESVHDEEPFSAKINGWRGEEDVPAVVVALPMDRDVIPAASGWLIYGMALDELTIALDTYKATEITNPRTGRMWASGEMADAVENHNALDTGLVQEALVILGGRRQAFGSATAFRCYPYRRVEGVVTWLKSKRLVSDSNAYGPMLEALSEAFERVPVQLPGPADIHPEIAQMLAEQPERRESLVRTIRQATDEFVCQQMARFGPMTVALPQVVTDDELAAEYLDQARN